MSNIVQKRKLWTISNLNMHMNWTLKKKYIPNKLWEPLYCSTNTPSTPHWPPKLIHSNLEFFKFLIDHCFIYACFCCFPKYFLLSNHFDLSIVCTYLFLCQHYNSKGNDCLSVSFQTRQKWQDSNKILIIICECYICSKII